MIEEVFVGHKLVDKCEKKARGIIKDRGSRRNKRFTKPYDATTYLEKHVAGLVAECAMCLFLGADPFEALDWQTKKADGGVDFSFNGKTIDVKASNHPGARRLMWPVKNIDAMKNIADVLVWARVLKGKRDPLGQRVDLIGFIPGDQFRAGHRVAHGLPKIVDGTPYLNEIALYSIDQIRQHLQNI